MKNFCINFLFFTIIFINSSVAEIIKKIDVQGNLRVSKESIKVLGSIDIGKDYSNNDLNLILKNLYQTNFFNDIKLNLKNNILLIKVSENPTIQSVKFTGIKNKGLIKILDDKTKLKQRSSYVESIFIQDLNMIKNIIKASGYYFAEIKSSVKKNDIKNLIDLTYDINLGKRAKINKIIFLGDKKVKDRKLRNLITSEESRFWKFLSQKAYLDNQRIKLDVRLLENYYRNKGYYNVDVQNSFVEFENDGSFKLTFNINSGEKFYFNNIRLEYPNNYDSLYFESIKDLLSNLEKKPYSLNKLDKVLKEIDKIALSKQYEFIDASINEKIVDTNKLDLTITLNETEKFYVERINVLGNVFTLEEVIRNSLIVDEGEPYNSLLFNKSINNLKAKNYFKKVEYDLSEGSDKNLKIIDITVEEKPTGEVFLGAGIGSSGASIGGGIKENNFMGKGISLDTKLTISEESIKGQFIYSKPNFNYTDNTLYTSIRSTQNDYLKDYGYETSNTGVSIGTSFEQYEDLFFKPELSASLENLTTTSTASAALKKQDGDYFDLFFNYSLNYDKRNQKYNTTDGYRTIFIQDLPLISETLDVSNTLQFDKYYPLPFEMIGKTSLYGKAVGSLSGNDVRMSKRLIMPGSKLRGFEPGKIGPVDNSDYIGGNYLSTINLSTTLPQVLPSLEFLDFGLFLDIGNVWGVDYSDTVNESNKIRSSTGIAMDLLTPVGPLNFSLSQNLTKASSDKTETFRFNLGTTF